MKPELPISVYKSIARCLFQASKGYDIAYLLRAKQVIDSYRTTYDTSTAEEDWMHTFAKISRKHDKHLDNLVNGIVGSSSKYAKFYAEELMEHLEVIKQLGLVIPTKYQGFGCISIKSTNSLPSN